MLYIGNISYETLMLSLIVYGDKMFFVIIHAILANDIFKLEGNIFE